MGQSGDPCLFVIGYVVYLCVVGAFRYSARAMKRVAEIRERRQARFIKNRLKAGLKLQDDAEKKEVEKSIHLLQDPEVITRKVQEAQKQRQAAKSASKAMEMETE